MEPQYKGKQSLAKRAIRRLAPRGGFRGGCLEIVVLYHRVVARLIGDAVAVEDPAYVGLLGGLDKPLAVQAAVIDRTAEESCHLRLDGIGLAIGKLVQHAFEALAVQLGHVGEEVAAALTTTRLVLARVQDTHALPLGRQHPGGPLAQAMPGPRASLVETVHEVGRDPLVIE